MTTNEAEISPVDNREVVYIRDNAFTKCDCGKDLGLVAFTPGQYQGKCLCGKRFRLQNNKIWEVTDEN